MLTCVIIITEDYLVAADRTLAEELMVSHTESLSCSRRASTLLVVILVILTRANLARASAVLFQESVFLAQSHIRVAFAERGRGVVSATTLRGSFTGKICGFLRQHESYLKIITL